MRFQALLFLVFAVGALSGTETFANEARPVPPTFNLMSQPEKGRVLQVRLNWHMWDIPQNGYLLIQDRGIPEIYVNAQTVLYPHKIFCTLKVKTEASSKFKLRYPLQAPAGSIYQARVYGEAPGSFDLGSKSLYGDVFVIEISRDREIPILIGCLEPKDPSETHPQGRPSVTAEELEPILGGLLRFEFAPEKIYNLHTKFEVTVLEKRPVFKAQVTERLAREIASKRELNKCYKPNDPERFWGLNFCNFYAFEIDATGNVYTVRRPGAARELRARGYKSLDDWLTREKVCDKNPGSWRFVDGRWIRYY